MMHCSASSISPAISHRDAFEAVHDVIKELNGATLVNYEAIKKGGNNAVYRLMYSDHGQYALKIYPPLFIDSRNRLNAEFRALSFLHQQGETQVPVPIKALEEQNVGIYRWIAGESVQQVKNHDIDSALKFMSRLHGYKGHRAAKTLAFASEAYRSYGEAKQQLQQRWRRLYQQAQPATELKDFLERRYQPSEQILLDYLEKQRLVRADKSNAHLTLSPSDFGFHNAIKPPDGELVFVDLEYFGWDDPAKLIADFLWHPGMVLSETLKHQFVAGAVTIYGENDLLNRFKTLYVLCGLRWCLIMLNEFLPDGRAKRRLSGKMDSHSDPELLSQQLRKAEEHLDRLLSTYEQNPYAN